jgi:hypothetical protein
MTCIFLSGEVKIIIINTGGEEDFIPNAYVGVKSHHSTGHYKLRATAERKKFLHFFHIALQSYCTMLDYDVQVNLAPTSNSRKNVMASWSNEKKCANQIYTSR